MSAWQTVFRRGIVPQLSTAGLLALRLALEEDSPTLIQGATVRPLPIPGQYDSEPTEADPVAYAIWRGESLRTVRQVEDRFAAVMFECDQLVGEPAACRWWTNFVDDIGREELFRLVLGEVRSIIKERLHEKAEGQGVLFHDR